MHRLEGNDLSETVDREAVFGTKFIFAPFSKFDVVSKVPFSQSGSHILYVALNTFPCIDYLIDVHVDERLKIKKTIDPKPLRMFAQILLKFFPYL